MPNQSDSQPRFRRPWWLPRQLTHEDRALVVEGILESAFPSRRFFTLLTLSTAIAALGLLANSGAVIIGAMIIAPLMGPILGLAYGLVSVKPDVERRALIAEVSGVLLTITLGYLIGQVPLHPAAGSEMLARTSPTIYDIGIALASGLAGAYASANRQVNSALAGVAISVALVPPLATCGLFLAMGAYDRSFQALLLFAANFFCIQLAAAFVFWIYGLGNTREVVKLGAWKFALRFAPATLAIVGMGWFMTGTLIRLVREQNLDSEIKRGLNGQIAQRTGGRLDQIVERQIDRNGIRLVAIALTPKVIESAQVSQIEQVLSKQLDSNVTLTLRSVVSQDIDRSGRVFYSETDRNEAAKSEEAASELDQAKRIIVDELKSIPGAALDSVERSSSGDTGLLVASVKCPVALTSSEVLLIEEHLVSALGHPVKLVVMTTATTVTDREGNLYQPQPEALPEVDPLVRRYEAHLVSALKGRMSVKPARRLTSHALVNRGGRLELEATVEAIEPVGPEEINAIQTDFRKFVYSAIDLKIRTNLTSTATATGWVGN